MPRPVPNPSGSTFDLDNQVCPMMLALINAVATQNGENQIEGAQATVLQDLSSVATSAMNNGDAYLESLAGAMSGSSVSGAELTKLQTAYSVAQTEVSNTNNQFSTGVATVQTGITSMTETQQQTLQAAGVTNNWLSALHQELQW